MTEIFTFSTQLTLLNLRAESTVKDMGFFKSVLEICQRNGKAKAIRTSVYNLKKIPINRVKLDTVGKVPPRPAAVT